LGLLIGLNALGGLIYYCFILMRLPRDSVADLPDRLSYGASPVLGYAAALVAACFFFLGSAWAPEVLAGALVLLLIVNIRNAWDLTLSLARMQSDNR